MNKKIYLVCAILWLLSGSLNLRHASSAPNPEMTYFLGYLNLSLSLLYLILSFKGKDLKQGASKKDEEENN